MMNRKTGIEY